MSQPNQAVARTQSVSQAVEARQVAYLAFGTVDKMIELNLGMVRKYIAAPAYDRDSKQQIQISDTEAIQFMMLLQARRLDPWDGDAFAIPFWDSKAGCHRWALITAHHAFLKRAEFSTQYDGMESGVIVEVDGEYRDLVGDFVPDTLDGAKVKLSGGWAKVVRKDRSIPTYRRAKLTTFQKDFGQWVKDPAGMIVKCAEADALRSAFPSACGGLYLREEMGHTIDVTSEPAPERRPDFGQIMDANRPASAQRKPKVITEAKTPQEAPGQQPATPSQPAEQTAAAPAEPPAQAPVEPPATVPQTARQDPEGLNHSGRQGDMPPEEDLSTPPETEPPQEAAQGEAPAAFVPDFRDTAPVQNVKRLCHESGLTVEQLMTWARAKKISTTPGQKLEELAEGKLLNIAKQWGTILPIIRQTAQK